MRKEASDKIFKNQSLRLVRKHHLAPGIEMYIFFPVLCFLFSVCFVSACAADSLSQAEALYLQGSYSDSISECALNIENNKMPDKAYYLLSLNYLKINDTDKAREKLTVLINNFKHSRYLEEAKLAYADSYFIEQDYPNAKRLYEAMRSASPRLESIIYLRLSQCALKLGDWEEAKRYSVILKEKYPLSLESAVVTDIAEEKDLFFTVQVGAFTSLRNAQKLLEKLKERNFDAYLDESSPQGRHLYRVRVGRLKTLPEAKTLKNILDNEGYPTRIFP